MSETAGKINAYTCEKCARKIITINRDDGVTPFMIRCVYCGAMAQSGFYRVPQTLTPTHEWYMPDGEEIVAMQFHPELKDTIEHVKRGGLLKRAIGGPTWFESWKESNQAPDRKRGPYEARQMNEDPGPRLLVHGCQHCQHYRITLYECAMYEGSYVQIFDDYDSVGEALADACFWGSIIGIPVEIEDGFLKDLVDGDIIIRGRNGEIIAGPSEEVGAGQEPRGPGLPGGRSGGDRAPVEPRGVSAEEVQAEAPDSLHANQGCNGQQSVDPSGE